MLLCGCSLVAPAADGGRALPDAPLPTPAPAPMAEVAPAPAPAPTPPAPPAAAPPGADVLLEYADRVRAFAPAELAQEINRLGDPQDAPVRLVQLALALGASRAPGSGARAQAMLQKVLAQSRPEAQALHPLARLLSAHYGDARRAEEQTERQAQQVRDAQRRIEQLNDRLEAVRAIERSLPSPAGTAPGSAAIAAPAGSLRP